MVSRVLVVHNAYRLRGGEDAVVDAESMLLRSHGHEVELLAADNSTIDDRNRIALATNTVWSSEASRRIELAIRRFEPDLVHVHNFFPLLSPSIFWAAGRLRKPVVQTLHNFRLLCPQATFLRNGRICDDCLGRSVWRGVARGCYRGSKAQSAVLGAMLETHRLLGTWRRKVTRFIALNDFCKRQFVRGGIPESKICVKPNFVDIEHPAPVPRQGFLYVGRLSSEKGIEVLARSAELASGFAEVTVAGSGPMESLVERSQLTMRGAIAPSEVQGLMTRSIALIIPSICYESFPRTLVEAMACGLPVIGSALGPLGELIQEGETGLLFEPGNPEDLARKLLWASENPGRMAAMGVQARRRYERMYSGTRNYQQLIAIYRAAMMQNERANLS